MLVTVDTQDNSVRFFHGQAMDFETRSLDAPFIEGQVEELGYVIFKRTESPRIDDFDPESMAAVAVYDFDMDAFNETVGRIKQGLPPLPFWNVAHCLTPDTVEEAHTILKYAGIIGSRWDNNRLYMLTREQIEAEGDSDE